MARWYVTKTFKEHLTLSSTRTHCTVAASTNTLSTQGLLGVNIPAEVGGVGGSFLEEQIVIEEGAYRYSWWSP